MVTIDVASDFHPNPAGRYRTDSDTSAQAFREDYLVPMLIQHGQVKVFLAEYHHPSWLEEAFGGLIREHEFTEEELRRSLNFLHMEHLDNYIHRSWEYIRHAQTVKDSKSSYIAANRTVSKRDRNDAIKRKRKKQKEFFNPDPKVMNISYH